jgi:hypothetical protein
LGFTALGDRVTFTATDPEHGRRLWVTDGTSDGTRAEAGLSMNFGADISCVRPMAFESYQCGHDEE